MTAYQRYQLQWMLNHGYSLEDLIDELSSLQAENLDYKTPVSKIFRDWEHNSGFGGELWACEAEWAESEGTGCTECDSRYCIFNPDGVCLFPIIYGKKPMLTEEDGCLSSVFDEGIAVLKSQTARSTTTREVATK